MKKRNDPTLVSISEHLNVSISTVSRALSGQSKKYRISEKTTQLILETAKQFNYKPNQLARGLRLKKTNTIGVIVPDITNPFFSVIVRSIENAARQNDVTILISDSNNQSEFEKSAVKEFVSRKIDGLIIAPIGHESLHITEVNDMSIPIVLMDRYLSDIDAPFVGSDNYLGAKEAVNFLIKNGHHKIGLNQGFKKSSVNQDRFEGYCDALTESGITVDPNLIVGDNFDEESGYIGAKLLLGGRREITAIFAANNSIALGSIKAIQEEKLHIPDDISILSFDDQSFYNYFSPPLSSVAQQTKEIGRIAYKILTDMIDKKSSEQPHKIQLPTQLIMRESVKDIRVLTTN